MDSIYAFCNTQNKINKNYGSHRENYLRFAIEVFVRKVDLPIKELISELEKYYIPNDDNQYPVLEGKKYWLVVLV